MVLNVILPSPREEPTLTTALIIEVITNGRIAIFNKRRNNSFIGVAMETIGSPISQPASIPRKKPAKISVVSMYFLFIRTNI